MRQQEKGAPGAAVLNEPEQTNHLFCAHLLSEKGPFLSTVRHIFRKFHMTIIREKPLRKL
jgi:hypothetical protein